MEERGFYLVAYDISHNKRRTKVARVMESVGARVQGSVFEVWLNSRELEDMQQRLKKVLADKEDSIRIYFLCNACQKKVMILGQGKKNAAPELVIV
ncbi:MAG: CRISPR-associated endonuclease Cas2 [Anaerolineae bacterium]|nr:CRISPR-associated endonuclease Cas2 [Anaerolineae bacterium]